MPPSVEGFRSHVLNSFRGPLASGWLRFKCPPLFPSRPYTTSRHPPSPHEFPHAGGVPTEERALIILDEPQPSAPLHWRPQRVLFRHCHGGICVAPTHKPCFVSRACCSSLANSVFLGAYFRYHQHQPSRYGY